MKRVTPLLLVLGIIAIIAWTTAINGLILNSGGGNSLGGGIAALFAFLVTILIWAERSIVKKSKITIKKIWLIELPLAILIILGTFYLMSS